MPSGLENMPDAQRRWMELYIPPSRTVEGTSDIITEADNGGLIYYECGAPCTVTFPDDLPDGFTCRWIDNGPERVTFSDPLLVNVASHDTTSGVGAMGSVTAFTPTLPGSSRSIFLTGDLA